MLNTIASSGWAIGVILLAIGVGIFLLGLKKSRILLKILGIIGFALGFFGLLQGAGILSGVPVLAFGIPAVLSAYFDVFASFVQAFVFTLLTMVYIAGACPPPETAEAE